MSGIKQFVLRGNVVARKRLCARRFHQCARLVPPGCRSCLLLRDCPDPRGDGGGIKAFSPDALSRLDDSEKETLRKLLRKLGYAAENQASAEGSVGRREPATGERS